MDGKVWVSDGNETKGGAEKMDMMAKSFHVEWKGVKSLLSGFLQLSLIQFYVSLLYLSIIKIVYAL